MRLMPGQVAVITGAASGIGLAMAHQFAQHGLKLVLSDIESASLQKALAELTDLGATAIAVQADVSSETQVKALADAAYSAYGAVHVLCNNAGVATPALRTLAWETPLSDWEWIHRVNLLGVLYGVREFVPRMLAGGAPGHVVNTASVAGLVTGSNPYFVYKHAVSCFTEGLYKDLRAVGAHVSASVLCPGLIRTRIMEAERNRPVAFGPSTDLTALAHDVQTLAAKFKTALDHGFEPAHVAAAVFDGIQHDHYYIIPAQPALLEFIDVRMQDIQHRRNPTIPAPVI